MIDYDKLKKAHEIAANLFEHFVIEINIMHGAIGSESGRLKYNYNYQNMGWDNEILFPHVEYLLCELQKLQKPEPRYKEGQEVWMMYLPPYTDSTQPGKFKTDAHKYEDGIHQYCLIGNGVGLTWRKENVIYPTREALIEAQIKYWTDLKQECKSVTDCHHLKSECKHESADNRLYPGNHKIPSSYLCKHCGEFYR